ncbi:hypothetical protein ACEWY4_017103 [Coilia grayii]|uniref:Integrase catalytic domain-containing protein n=1 Tax=Coilia grayii TaxID=363190 RepID=A0ABD1JFV3_9TELE
MLGLDLMGPLPQSSLRNTQLLVVVDYHTRWVELFPLRQATAEAISKCLVKDVLTRWGAPTYLLSDRGPQFVSDVLKDVCARWGVIQKLTTVYHPQTNLTERVNRTLKTMLSSYVGNQHKLWDMHLPELRFAINTAVQESTSHSPAELRLYIVRRDNDSPGTVGDTRSC